MRCQLEAYKNEVDLVRGDLKGDLESKEKQLKVLQQTVQNLQKVRNIWSFRLFLKRIYYNKD